MSNGAMNARQIRQYYREAARRIALDASFEDARRRREIEQLIRDQRNADRRKARAKRKKAQAKRKK